MSKYVLIPDSFKGTMSSSEICGIMRAQIAAHDPGATIVSIPVADGGEGSVDCFLEAMGGDRVELDVCGPFEGETMRSFYGLVDNGKTAVIEMAACAGLPLVEGRADPKRATTYGVGEMMVDAAKRGVAKIIVGLGGSATNDGGCGAASAAGIRFYDANGRSFVPTGGTLADIDRIDSAEKSPCLEGVEIIAMCDIDNPMYGDTGAAAIFGPQKGADPSMVAELDQGLRHLDRKIRQDLKLDVSRIPGAGAAGAMGAGMPAFFGASLRMGIETVLDVVGFENIVKDASLVLTGEGKIDTQSLRGKVVIGVSRRAKMFGVPVIAIVGDIGDNIQGAYEEGVSGIVSINRVAVDFKVARNRSRDDMALTVDNLIRMFITFSREAAK